MLHTRSYTGIHKIRHIVVIMQENRSFDSYFGTYPGADGIPRRTGPFAVCVPDPTRTRASSPYHDSRDRNAGGPHDHIDAVKDIAGGAMSGFIAQARESAARCSASGTSTRRIARSPRRRRDVMGYHDAREIPNYWAYAKHFVLQDHMFQPDTSWSLPSHLYLVSGWSAQLLARRRSDELHQRRRRIPGRRPASRRTRRATSPDYAWTDLTYLLHKHHVSWRYYVFKGTQPDCDDNAMFCKAVPQNAKTPGIWNPLP